MDEQTTLRNIEALFDQNNYTDALITINDSLIKENKGNNEDFHLIKAICLKKLHNYDLSLDSFNTAILFNPTKAIAYAAKGNLLYETGKFVESIENYNKANDLNAKINIYTMYSYQYLLSEHEESLRHYESAIEKAGNSLGSKIINKRKKSLETYEKMKLNDVFYQVDF